jgi:hypothetical protein
MNHVQESVEFLNITELFKILCQQMRSLLKHKMLQFTVKIYLYIRPLHVSVHSDHHQGAMSNLAKVTVFVELVVKIHS